ncbi:MAG TPA: adenylyl-sulfate kinase [Bryobacteraceae bacterium]|nr:adenylyl-sulfate kinase [Bryobacteraceae bacterium]
MASKPKQGFAIWITGLPASGKSTLAAFLNRELERRGVDVAVLESDVLRKVFTPQPQYTPEERDAFYRQMVFVGSLLTRHGVAVIFDATAHRRAYRKAARDAIPHFIEVYVDCPLAVCIARDPKRIYQHGREGRANAVPGLQEIYEIPESPDILICGDSEDPEAAAARIIAKLVEKGYL